MHGYYYKHLCIITAVHLINHGHASVGDGGGNIGGSSLSRHLQRHSFPHNVCKTKRFLQILTQCSRSIAVSTK